MKFALLVCFCLLVANTAEGMLRAEPSISSVAIDAHDPDVIYLHLKYVPCKAAFSTDGGVTFQALDERKIPQNLTITLSNGTRRYVLADSFRLLRSDDGGATWTNTGATARVCRARRCAGLRVCRLSRRHVMYWTVLGMMPHPSQAKENLDVLTF